MPKFKVFVNGRNYWVNLDGERRRFGFYTTRFVEAASPEEAEERAVQLLREDAELTAAILNDASDPPGALRRGDRKARVVPRREASRHRSRMVQGRRRCVGELSTAPYRHGPAVL